MTTKMKSQLSPFFTNFTIIVSNFAVTGYHAVTATSRYIALTP